MTSQLSVILRNRITSRSDTAKRRKKKEEKEAAAEKEAASRGQAATESREAAENERTSGPVRIAERTDGGMNVTERRETSSEQVHNDDTGIVVDLRGFTGQDETMTERLYKRTTV